MRSSGNLTAAEGVSAVVWGCIHSKYKLYKYLRYVSSYIFVLIMVNTWFTKGSTENMLGMLKWKNTSFTDMHWTNCSLQANERQSHLIWPNTLHSVLYTIIYSHTVLWSLSWSFYSQHKTVCQISIKLKVKN